MLENINSGDDYAQLIMDTIIEGEKQIPVHAQMPIELLTYLAEEIQVKANVYYNEYITGQRETFIFTDEEMEEMFNRAGELYVNDQIDGLVDKGMLDVHVSEGGEFLYSLSEQGKQIVTGNKSKRGRPKKK